MDKEEILLILPIPQDSGFTQQTAGLGLFNRASCDFTRNQGLRNHLESCRSPGEQPVLASPPFLNTHHAGEMVEQL